MTPAPGNAEGKTWGDLEEHRLHARVMARLFGEPAEPTCIGRFRVERRLGEGAMGVVYAAVDDQLGRRVAIKLLHPHLAHDDLGRARLLREARAMARLEHANIVRIYEASAWNEQVYLAMELVDGVTLDTWLRGQRRPWREVLAIFGQAGRALSAAHRAGFLHRDFKPENVLVDAHGRAHVLDFGLARAVDGAREDMGDDLLEPLTRTGSILGTPAYMAPEQLRGGEVDARSDQFSFCVALFEGLHGTRPFDQVPRFGPLPTVARASARVPARVRRALARGLAEQPAARWPDMDALLAALERPARARLLSRLLSIVGAAAGGALVAGLSAVWLLRGPGEAGEPRAPVAGETSRPASLAAEEGARPAAELQERRHRVAAASAELRGRDPTAALLVLREIEAEPGALLDALAEPISAAVLAGHEGPVRSIRFVETGVETVDAAGHVRRFPRDGRGRAEPRGDVALDPRRSPDGALTLRMDGERVALVRDGGRPIRLARATGPIEHVAWSSDGAWVAAGATDGAVWLAPRTGGKAHRLGARGVPVRALAWAADARRVAVGRDDGSLAVWQRGRTWRRVEVAADIRGAATALAFSPDGRRLAVGVDDGTIRLLALDVPRVHVPAFRGHTGPISALAFADDGVQIASGSEDGTARVWQPVPRALAIHSLSGPLNSVAWRPDGVGLAAAGDHDAGVWLLPADGGAGRALPHPRTVYAVAWSPDGAELATADEAGEVRRWRRDSDGPPQLAEVRGGELLALAWGPAGLAAGGMGDAITIWPSGQEHLRRSPRRGNVEALAWSPSGEQLAAAIDDGVLARIDARGVPLAADTLDASEGLVDLAWRPTGDALAVVDERRTLWRVPIDGERSSLGRYSVALWSTAWDPQDRFIATGAADGAVSLWPVKEGSRVDLFGHGDIVHAVAFDPGGGRLASAGADGRVIVWPMPGADLRAHLARITSVCLTPDQRRTLLGEPADAALAAATACESAAGR